MEKKKNVKKIIIAVLSAVVFIALAVLLTITVIIPAANYSKATKLLNGSEYSSAAMIFADLGEYKDAPSQVLVCKYKEAERLESSGRKAAAAMAFGALGDYSDSRKRSFALWDDIAFRETLTANSEEAAFISNNGSVFHIDSSKTSYLYQKKLEECGTNVIDIEFMRYAPVVALRNDGTLSEEGKVYSSWTDIVAIDSDQQSLVALKSDGTVLYDSHYDARDYGQSNVSGWKNIVAVECDNEHTVGLRSNGTVIATGNNKNGQCEVEDWKDIVAISADGGITLGLKADGTVVCTDSETDVSGWTDIEYISASSNCIVGVKSDGTVLHIGKPSHDICTEWKNISAIKCPQYDDGSPIGITNDGNLTFVMKPLHERNIDNETKKEWSKIKQPKIKGFYDFDHEIVVDINAERNSDELNGRPYFVNKYGSPTTVCAHAGCSAYIASSGDTNCCNLHSNRCGNCHCYIDEDAMYCMNCIENALK